MFEVTTNRMKRTRLFVVLALLGVATSFWQCGGDPAPAEDPKDAQLKKLSQTWKATAVTFNSTPITGYENFQITMTGTVGQSTFNYNTTGRPSGILTPWAASGTFTFGTDFSTVLNRDDGTVVTYSVTATQLQMTFTYTGAGYTGSRVNNVNGSWSFVFGL
jgi:hypothetical protein